MVPWRVKNFVSEHFPLFYHLAANAGLKGNDQEHWNKRLEETWDDPSRTWPTKNELVASMTSPSDVILDIACGTGSILRYLKSIGYRSLHGMEISDLAIRRLSAEGIHMHYGVLPQIPLNSATFDVVIASQVLEHIIRRGKFVTEIRRILKPGGRGLFFVPNNCLGPIDEKEHVIKYTADSLERFLSRHFGVVRVQEMKDANHRMGLLFAEVRNETQKTLQ